MTCGTPCCRNAIQRQNQCGKRADCNNDISYEQCTASKNHSFLAFLPGTLAWFLHLVLRVVVVVNIVIIVSRCAERAPHWRSPDDRCRHRGDEEKIREILREKERGI